MEPLPGPTSLRTEPPIELHSELPVEPPVELPADVQENLNRIIKSPSYRLAEDDTDFLARPELRAVRMQLELLKPEMALAENGVRSTIVLFGGTQVVPTEIAQARLREAERALATKPSDPRLRRDVTRAKSVLAKSPYYDAAREFSRLVTADSQGTGVADYVIVTGGGPGIMEAGNRGAYEAGGKSVGLNILLPAEQSPNPYITPQLCFQFHYFAMRKLHFLLRAKALIVFPGGFGTLDEFFDALTLRQTRRMQEIPIIMFGRRFWEQVVNLRFLADEGVIADEHVDLVSFADTPQEAWDLIATFHGRTAAAGSNRQAKA